MLQNSVDEITGRAVFGKAVFDVADAAGDADVREADLCHFGLHGGNDPGETGIVIAFAITQDQDGYAIADAFVHQVFWAVTRRVGAVDIAGLVMGAFMAVDKALIVGRRGRVV